LRGRWDRALIGGGGGGGIDGEGSVVAMSGWLEREPTMEGEKEMWGLSQWKKREKCVSISSVHHCLCMDFQCSGLFFFCYLHLLPHIFLGFEHQVPGRRRQSGPQWWPPGRLWGQFILDLENWTRLWLIGWVPCSFYATLDVRHGEGLGLIFWYVLATQ